MKSEKNSTDLLYDTSLKSVPELSYEEPSIDSLSLFQKSCLDFCEAQSYTEFDTIYFIFREECHVCIPLMPLKDARAMEISDREGFFGVLISPQGYCQITCTHGDQEDSITMTDEWLQLNHPAELGDIRTVFSGPAFEQWRGDTVYNDYTKERIILGTLSYEAPLSPEYSKRHIQLSSILEDVFLLLEEEPYCGKLIPITALASTKEGNELLEKLKIDADRNRHDNEGLGYPHWKIRYEDHSIQHEWEGSLSEFQEKANRAASKLEKSLVPLSHYDIVYGQSGELVSAQLLGTTHRYFHAAPKFVLRANRNVVAFTRFYDLLKHTMACKDNCIFTILENPAGWRKATRQKKVELESEPADQMRASVSLRQAIELYKWIESGSILNGASLDEVERHAYSLSQSVEGFIKNGYKKILEPHYPPRLPHFLEIAYQKFIDGRSDRSRSEQSRNLLNLLGRSLLYFMLEDVSAAGISDHTIEGIEREISSNKPPSDGRLYDLQLSLIKTLSKTEKDQIPDITGTLMHHLPAIIRNHLQPLVTKRNRANHPPYDEDGFLAEAEKQFPQAIDALRRGFSSLELLVPIHFKSNDKGEIIVTAKSLTGSHFEYPDLDFKSAQSPDKTPSDTLLLCQVFKRQNNLNPASKKRTQHVIPEITKATPLRRFFKQKHGYKKMIMTGILDRVANGEAIFEYIEE